MTARAAHHRQITSDLEAAQALASDGWAGMPDQDACEVLAHRGIRLSSATSDDDLDRWLDLADAIRTETHSDYA